MQMILEHISATIITRRMQGIVRASLSKHHMYALACAKVGKFEDGCMFMMNKKCLWSEAT